VSSPVTAPSKAINGWAVLLDLDNTPVLSDAIESLRRKPWSRCYHAFGRSVARAHVEAGCLREVGFKFGRYLDLMFYQIPLKDREA
jgi:hypothetical protein